MYAQIEKSTENQSRAVANSVTKNKSNGRQGFYFVDNRPEALIQRKMTFGAGTKHLNNTSGILDEKYYNSTYMAIINEGKNLEDTISVKQVGSVSVGLGAQDTDATASYVPDKQEIHVRESNREKYSNNKEALEQTLSGEMGAFAHETGHAIDHLKGVVDYVPNTSQGDANKIRTEWRSWAVEAAVAKRNMDNNINVTPNQERLIASYQSKEAFKEGYSWTRTKKYLQAYLHYNEMREMRNFMVTNDAWIDEALGYYQENLNRVPETISEGRSWKAYAFLTAAAAVVVLALIANYSSSATSGE